MGVRTCPFVPDIEITTSVEHRVPATLTQVLQGGGRDRLPQAKGSKSTPRCSGSTAGRRGGSRTVSPCPVFQEAVLPRRPRGRTLLDRELVPSPALHVGGTQLVKRRREAGVSPESDTGPGRTKTAQLAQLMLMAGAWNQESPLGSSHSWSLRSYGIRPQAAAVAGAEAGIPDSTCWPSGATEPAVRSWTDQGLCQVSG